MITGPNPTYHASPCIFSSFLSRVSTVTRDIDIAILSVCVSVSNRAILNDFEPPQTQISRSGHSLTLNISKMATDTAIVTIEGEYETALKLLNGTSFNDLE